MNPYIWAHLGYPRRKEEDDCGDNWLFYYWGHCPQCHSLMVTLFADDVVDTSEDMLPCCFQCWTAWELTEVVICTRCDEVWDDESV